MLSAGYAGYAGRGDWLLEARICNGTKKNKLEEPLLESEDVRHNSTICIFEL